MSDKRAALALKLAEKANSTYGAKTAFAGMNPIDNGVLPTGILQFDYMSGIGGIRRGTAVEVFGPPHIGKTSAFGYPVLGSAQQQGLLTGMINVEPSFDNGWVVANGINPDYNVTVFPDNLNEAFEILHEWVYDGTLDVILFDSMAGSSTENEQKEGAVAQFGGASKLITWNFQRIITRMMKNNVTVIFVNQIRDTIGGNISGLVDSPGGWAAKHLCEMRIQLKRGRNRYTMKVPGAEKSEDKIVGQEIAAVFKKAKTHNALGNTARYDFYHIDTDGLFPYGIDHAQDIINTGLISGVFQKDGTYYHYPEFPDGKLYGKPKVQKFFEEHPETVTKVREDVIAKMNERVSENAKKELVNNG
jgi:recombination protein RecA